MDGTAGFACWPAPFGAEEPSGGAVTETTGTEAIVLSRVSADFRRRVPQVGEIINGEGLQSWNRARVPRDPL